MATDDERRLVAERLRMSDDRDAAGFDCLLANAVRGRDFCETPCEECHGRLLDELADLIDPDCDEGRYEGVHTARPVDREALLALAEEMELAATRLRNLAGESASFGFLSRGLTEAEAKGFARRIREACGEAS